MSMRKGITLLACMASIWGVALAQAEIVGKGTLRLSLSGKLSPRGLPRDGTAPIAVSIGGQVETTDGSAPPQLKTMRIEVNRNGRFDYAGLPICAYSRIQPATTTRALTACRSSLVGKGSFTASITLGGQEPYSTKGRLLVFNGVSGGKPVLFGQIYSPYPFATSFVIVFNVQKIAHGTYGTALSASLPKALGSWGNLTGIEMTLSRRYSIKGVQHSYLSAGCPAPKGFPGATFPLMRSTFGFAGGQTLQSTLIRDCKVR
jgi:hypothetical protein